MDSHQPGRLWVFRFPRAAYWTILIALFWFPVYESLHQGQITLIITALFAFGMGRSGFTRGFVTGLASALKPTYGIFLPFMPILFGKKAIFGIIVGLLPAFIPPEWFIDYIENLPRILSREYHLPSPAGILGTIPSAAIACVINLMIVWKVKDKEGAYVLIISVGCFFTALWLHSHTPIILAVIYYLNKYHSTSQVAQEIGLSKK